MAKKKMDICIVGGAGRVGLPLGIVLASRGLSVIALDIDTKRFATIRKGKMPFLEKGAEPLLKAALKKKLLTLTDDPAAVGDARVVIITVGTPIDEFLNPKLYMLADTIKPLLPHISDDQLILLRSTVFPGTTEWLHAYLRSNGRRPLLSFCPERIVEGQAVEELQSLPQIVSGMTKEAEDAAAAFFEKLSPDIVRLTPREAEFAKLFCNAHRYIQFAVSNQFYMMANTSGLDYYRILKAVKHNYKRMDGLLGAGFTAGPCLLKDTLQLAASYNNDFGLGHAAMQVNERLPIYIVNQLSREHDISKAVVGLLGMAFKTGSDDARSSLSYKLKKVLRFRAKEVLTTDPLVNDDPDLLPLDEVLERADLLILCTPHPAYRNIKTGEKPIVDVWNFLGKGGRV